MSLKGMTATRTMPVNSYTQPDIMEITQRYREIELAANKGSGAGDMMAENIKRALDSLPWSVGDSTDMISGQDFEKVVGTLSPEVQAFDRMAGELRADQFIAVTVGMPLDRPVAFAETQRNRKS
jgi:hypothetical protein